MTNDQGPADNADEASSNDRPGEEDTASDSLDAVSDTSELVLRKLFTLPSNTPLALVGRIHRELPAVGDDTIARILQAVPAYNGPDSGRYAQIVRESVVLGLGYFAELVADPAAPLDKLHDLCDRLGKYEADEDRELKNLLAAFTVASHVGIERVAEIVPFDDQSRPLNVALNKAIVGFCHYASSRALGAYYEARFRSPSPRERTRFKLQRLLVRLDHVPPAALRTLARAAGFPLRPTYTPVALEAPEVPGETHLDPDDGILVNLTSERPHLIISGEITPELEAKLADQLPGYRLGVGLATSRDVLPHSLRWARQILELPLPPSADPRIIRCEDHLVNLLAYSDRPLFEAVIQRAVAMLMEMRAHDKKKLGVFRSWFLHSRSTYIRMGTHFGIADRTVRKKIGEARKLFGISTSDIDGQVILLLAFRELAKQVDLEPISDVAEDPDTADPADDGEPQPEPDDQDSADLASSDRADDQHGSANGSAAGEPADSVESSSGPPDDQPETVIDPAD